MKALKRITTHITSLIQIAAVAATFLLSMDYGAYAQGPTRIVVFGDSLTSGYKLRPEESFPSRLDAKLRQIGYDNVEIINMSVAGDTTTTAIDRLGQLVAKQPDIVLLQLGANDVLRGININVIYNNMAQILDYLIKQQKYYVIMMGMKPPSTIDYTYGRQVEATYKQLFDLYHPVFYPDTLAGIAGKPELNIADGLHPNASGVDVMVEGIYRDVDAALRWKWEAQQYQQQYQQYQVEESAVPQSTTQPSPDPASGPPVDPLAAAAPAATAPAPAAQ